VVLLMLIVNVMTERSGAYICASAELTGHTLLTEIATATLGAGAGSCTAWVLVLYCFGSCIGGLVVIKQLLPPSLAFALTTFGVPADALPSPLLTLSATALLILVPLSSLSTMEKLRFTSMASVALQFVIVCTIGLAAAAAIGWAPGLAAPIEVAPPPPVPWLCLEPTAWMRAAPVVAFAFQFHQNSARPRAQRTHAPLQAGAEHS